MRILFIFVPLLFLLTTTSSNAAEHFYCDCQTGASNQCVAGSDSNDGLSNLSPKKSFADANAKFNAFSAGDSIKLCRGGVFSSAAKYTWVNTNCNASNTCKVTSFDLPNQTSPQLKRPKIVQTINTHLFSLADSGNSDPDGGYEFSNLDLTCPGCLRGGASAFFLFNDVDDVLIQNISMDGFNLGVSLQKSNTINTGNGKLDNITIKNSQIINSIRQGIQGGAENLTIEGLYFENNGEGTIFDHHIYISRGNNITIKNNELYRSSLDANGNCAGAPLVVHGTIDTLLIENNYVHEDVGKANRGCWGIAVDNGYSVPEKFTNVTIKNNKVVNVGNLAIGVTSCVNCVIENNVIFQQQAFSTTGIRAPNKTRADDDFPMSNITVRNNSYYTTIAGTGIDVGVEGKEHIITSNAIHYTGAGKFACFNFNIASSSYTAIDNNTCFLPNASGTSEWEKGAGTGLSAWQVQSGLGANSKNVDPQFTDPTLPLVDLSLKSTSSLRDTGHSTQSSTKDYRGKSRATPDIGAFEFGTFNPPAKTKGY